jgi:ABC-type transport system involved in multi-copper enzyme maturation permease subunit
MSPLIHSCAAWLQRTLTWSTSRRAWQERLAFALVLAGILAGAIFVRHLDLSYQVIFWGSVVVLLTVLLRQGWLKLFGPVLFFDLVRTARRERHFLIRGIYALGLLGLLCWVWFAWWAGGQLRSASGTSGLTEFASNFFYTFMIAQFVIITLLAPAYTAGAIAEEKERRTLEFLLATDLRDREIVLSKLLARLLNLGMLLLAGLPVLGFLQFLGGVDPDLVLAGYAATLATLASLGGLSILLSVLLRRSRDAILLSYLAVTAYFIGYVLIQLAKSSSVDWQSFPSTDSWTSPVTLGDLVSWYNAGNILDAIFVQLGFAGRIRGSLSNVLPGVLRDYVVFHGVVALVCSTGAVFRLRAVASKEAYGKVKRSPFRIRLFRRPAVSDHPMMWKEVFAEPRDRFHWLGKLLIAGLIVTSFVPAVLILDDYFNGGVATYVGEKMNLWVRFVGTAAACLALIGVAVRAATSISGERAGQTFDSLLTSPLDSDSILAGKWLGSVLTMRWSMLWLGAIYGLGVLMGGVFVLAVFLVMAAWLVQASFVALIGLRFSTTSRTSLRATVCTLLTVLGVWFGHWLIWMCCVPLLFANVRLGDVGEVLSWLLRFQLFGLTPPVMMGYLAFRADEFDNQWYRHHALEHLGMALVGICLWGAFTAVLWRATSRRLRAVARRMPPQKPEVPYPRRRLRARPDVPPAEAGPADTSHIPEVLKDDRPDPG